MPAGKYGKIQNVSVLDGYYLRINKIFTETVNGYAEMDTTKFF